MPLTGTPEDREQIRELYARYAFTIDHGPYDEWVKCFTADGVFDSPRLGRHEGQDALRKFTVTYKNSAGDAQVRHMMTNVTFRIEGDAGWAGAISRTTIAKMARRRLKRSDATRTNCARLMVSGYSSSRGHVDGHMYGRASIILRSGAITGQAGDGATGPLPPDLTGSGDQPAAMERLRRYARSAPGISRSRASGRCHFRLGRRWAIQMPVPSGEARSGRAQSSASGGPP